MQTSLELDDGLLSEAKEITGLPANAAVEEALRRLIDNHKRLTALNELEGIGWDGPHHTRPTFHTLAAEFRKLTADRDHTPSEILMREGRDER